MDILRQKIKRFLRDVLYSDQDNEQKADAFNYILEELEKVRKNATRDEKNYILSQIRKVSIVDQYTIPMIKEMCTKFIERFDIYYNLNTDSDVLVSDLDHARLGVVTYEFFNCEYLGEVGEKIRDPWTGISYGTQCRILFCLPISYNKGTSKWCTFLYDTGSKLNYISSETYSRLGIDFVGISSKIKVKIHDIETFVYSGEFDPKLRGINVIGDEFLSAFDCTLSLIYRNGRCTPKITRDVQ